MTIVAGALTVLLGVLFAAAGLMKLLRSREELLPQMPWVEDFSASSVRLIGGAEVAGGLGLLTGLMVTGLSGLAALCLALVMIGAVVVHVRRKEPLVNALPAAVLLICLLIVVFVRQSA